MNPVSDPGWNLSCLSPARLTSASPAQRHHVAMPWRAPDQEPVHRDFRLNPYRDRAGRLLRRNAPAATLYLRVELWWRQLSGHLWRRRWSEPMAWDPGRFIYRGESLRVQWPNDTESQTIREDVFGLDDPSE